MEVKEFTQGAFTDTFEGSAADLIAKIPATPAAPASPAAPAPPSTDPLNPQPTLDAERDAAAVIQEGTDQEPEPGAEPAPAVPVDPKKTKGRPVEKLDEPVRKLFSNLINEKVLFGFQDGKIETVKDVQDLLDANLNHRIEAQQQDIRDGVFRSMTPAMQAVFQYAGQVTSPSELLPLLQSTSNIEKFASLDPENPVHQEMIVRERMRMNGDPDAIIEAEITDLKDRAKLADKAKAYKPVLQQFYERQAQQLVADRQREEQEYFQQVQQNDQHIRKILDSESFDGIKMKNAHKGVVYELLAVPREEYGGGVGLYSVIDRLFQEGKFDRLAKIALLAGDEKGFEEVFSTKLKFQNADSQLRKLNTGGKSAGPTVTSDIDPDDTQPTLPRPSSRSGFGFATK